MISYSLGKTSHMTYLFYLLLGSNGGFNVIENAEILNITVNTVSLQFRLQDIT